MVQHSVNSALRDHKLEFKRLWKFSVGFYGVWVAHIGRQTGLLAKLAEAPMTEKDLIISTRLYKPAVQAWCAAGLAYGLIFERKGKLHLPRKMKAMLLETKHSQYIGGQFSYLALRSLEYDGLYDLFKHGRIRGMTSSSSFDAIQQATDWDHYAVLNAIKRKQKELHFRLAKGCRVLDVGCGAGKFLAKFREQYPLCSFTGIDPSDEAIRRASELKKISESISVIKQAGEDMNFSDYFDLVYLGESLYASNNKRKVIANCYHALRKGGTLAIVEGLIPTSKRYNDESRLIMGMQLDFALQGHKFMNSKDLTKSLKAEGFTAIRYIHFGGCLYLVTARKV